MPTTQKAYHVEVSDYFNGPKRWMTVNATDMTAARARARRGELVRPAKGAGYYEGGVYDTHAVVEVAR